MRVGGLCREGGARRTLRGGWARVRPGNGSRRSAVRILCGELQPGWEKSAGSCSERRTLGALWLGFGRGTARDVLLFIYYVVSSSLRWEKSAGSCSERRALGALGGSDAAGDRCAVHWRVLRYAVGLVSLYFAPQCITRLPPSVVGSTGSGQLGRVQMAAAAVMFYSLCVWKKKKRRSMNEHQPPGNKKVPRAGVGTAVAAASNVPGTRTVERKLVRPRRSRPGIRRCANELSRSQRRRRCRGILCACAPTDPK